MKNYRSCVLLMVLLLLLILGLEMTIVGACFPFGIVDCGAPPPDSCEDSDGYLPVKLQSFIPGEVNGFFDGQPYSIVDECVNPAVLSEKVCAGANGQFPSSVNVVCPRGCLSLGGKALGDICVP